MRRRAYPFALLSHLSVVVFLTVLFASSVLHTAIPQVESGTWKNAGSMSLGRTHSASALLNDGRVVISGGVSDAGATLNTAELFSAGAFAPVQPMAEARSHHAAVVLPDGRVLVTGGDNGGGVTNSAEIYDAAAGVWTVAKPMVEPRQGHTMALLSDGTVLVAGGQGPTGPVGTLEIYDPIAQDFFQVGILASARSNHAMAVLRDGRVLIAGGMAYGGDGQPAATNTAEIYDPATATVTPAASMGTARFGCTLTTLADGTIAAIGGSDGTQDLASLEIYDPASGTWNAASTPALAIPRSGHLAFRLAANNSVLIVGGTSAGTALASAEIYEPWSNSVRATGALAAARNGAAGSPLEAGRLLVAGGSNLATTEEYGFATLKTDKPDYSPFQKVTITGGGWQPGETVTLVLHESPTLDSDQTISTVADAFGNIYDDSFQTDAHDLDVRFLLTGRGSRFSAQIAFTDAGPLHHFKVNTPNPPQTANNGFNVTVTAQDAGNATVTDYTGTIHFTSSDPQAPVLPADYTFTAADLGVHQFNGLKLKTAGTQTISVNDTTDTTKTGTGSVVITAAVVRNLVVTGFPATTVADQAQDITVTAQDNFGNTNATYTGTVRFTSTDLQAVLPTDYTFTALDAGVHTFSAATRLRTVGTQTITATDTVTGTINGTESGITVTPGPAATLAVTGYPSPTIANDGHQVTVTAKDAFGNTATDYAGTVRLSSSSDTQAVLPADYIFLAADHGVHSIGGTKFRTAGTQSLTATDTVTATITGTQSGIVVTAAAAKILVVSGYPSPATAGTSNSFTVTAQDNFGNTATGYTGIVHFTSTDTPAVLPADYTFVSGDNGVHSFSATLKTVGTQSITAIDTVTATITGVQSGITVTPGDAASFTLSYPTPTVAGDSHQLTVTAQDAFGNTATGYLGTARFTSSDGQAALPADYTFVAADKGTNKFGNVKLKTVGTQSITATDTTTPSITGIVSGITVTPGPAKTLVVSGYASPAIAGTSNPFTVTAQDQYGNTATGYTGTVTFTSSDAKAVLPADYTFVAADNGVHSLAATLKTAATQTITATDTVTATITGAQSVTVNAAAAAALTLTYPATTVAGDAHNLNVTAQDPYGNTATGYAGTVHFTSSDVKAVLPDDYTFIPATDNGTHKFTNPKLKTVGTQSFTATDTLTATITGTVSGITVTPGPAKTLAVSGYASPAIAGTSNSFTVTAQDNFGNTATGYTGTVTFTSSDAQAVLPGDYTFVSGDNGVRSFSATLKTAGTRSISATDIGTATITGSQTGIVINGADASVLAVSGFPATATANTQHDVTVTAQDQYGNTAAGYAGTVHLTSSDGQAVLPADYMFIPATDNGTHNLTVRLRTAGPQSITATDTATASITGTQTGITITAAAAKILVLSGFPATTTANTPHDIIVTAQDNFGNAATGYTGIVHFTSTDAQAILPADYTFVSADAGVHTFSAAANLRTAGTQSITATDTVAVPTITGTESGIAVSGAAAATLSLTFPTPVVAGDARHLTVTAKDAFGNTSTGYVGIVKFTSSDLQANLPADYTFLATDAGTHTFNAVKLKTAGTQSITGTDGAAPTITGTVAGIVVTGAAASTLAVTGYPSPATAGIANNFTVTVQDAFGNTAAGYLGTVHFTSSDAAAVLPADYTFAAGDNSVHLFSATLNTVANKQSITATDAVTATITGTESNIRVSSGPATKLRVTGYPSPATAGVSNNFTVTAKDTNGNTVAEYTGTVHFTSSDGQAVLPADYTFASWRRRRPHFQCHAEDLGHAVDHWY